MKLQTLTLALAAPLALALAAPVDTLRYGVAADTTLEKTFVTKVALDLEEVRMVEDGQEIDPDMIGMELTLSSTSTFGWMDTYGTAREGGAPQRLTRTFIELETETSSSQSSIMGSQDLEVTSESELLGETVVFTFDDEGGAYAARFPEESDADAALLEGLVAETDLAFLLPAGDVEADASWEADPRQLSALLGPGGSLKLLPNEDDLPEEARGQGAGQEFTMAEMLGEVDGEITCTYVGMRTEDERSLMVIAVEIDVESSNDMTELMRQKMEEFDAMEGGSMSFDAVHTELVIEGEGELLWDAAAGHFAAFTFQGDMRQIMDMSMALSIGTRNVEIAQAMTMAGSLEFDFKATQE